MTRSLFHLPGLFLAWELKDGASPAALVDRAAACGFRWVVQEYGDPTTAPAASEVALLRQRCHMRGMLYGGWSVGVNVPLLEQAAANFWVFNVETDETDYSIRIGRFRAAHPLYPLGVVTDCGIDARPFVAGNVKCLPECYAEDSDPENHTPARMVARAHELGWREVFPVLGVYHEQPLSSYTLAGDGWSVYLDADMSDDDWRTAAGWNAASVRA